MSQASSGKRTGTSRRARQIEAKDATSSPSHTRLYPTTYAASKRSRSSLFPITKKPAVLLIVVVFLAFLLLGYARRSFESNGGTSTWSSSRISEPKQRLVMLVGPHKSASTSVQSYLVKLEKAGVLGQHNWKWIGNERNKGFAEASRYLLMGDTTTTGERDVMKERSTAESLQQIAKEEWDQGTNLVAAAEFLDYAAYLPDKEAILAMKRIKQWLPEKARDGVEAVIMYRTPRASHLVSAWKQQVGFRKAKTNEPWRLSLDGRHRKRAELGEPPHFSEWLCRGQWPNVMQYNISTIISAQVNPFGLAYAYKLYLGADVTMIDMAGVRDGDTPSSVLCDVLRLPCNKNGKLDDASAVMPKTRNKRPNPTDLGMTADEIEEAEQILRDMDCYYFCRLGDALTVISGKDDVFVDGNESWKACCDRIMQSDDQEKQLDAKVSSKRLIDLSCRAHENFISKN